ncbi:MAG: tetratricopeptide repeat protein [Armatimonadetes bacterium]|nr:tetratricopeptide repeat protein [Armatimonadota bacterium]
MSTSRPSNKNRGDEKLSSLMKQAECLADKGKYEEAIAQIKKAIAIFPNEPKCSIRLAEFYHAQKKIGPAVEAMKTAVGLDPYDCLSQERLLRALIELDRYDEAIKLAHKMLVTFPNNLYARDVLGIAYLQKGLLDNSLQAINQLIALAPSEAGYYFKRAIILQQKGLTRQAMMGFIQALEMDPSGDLAPNARQAIASLDSYQLKRVLTIAVDDMVFRVKLARDPASAVEERGFTLSHDGIAALRQIDFEAMPVDTRKETYH